MNEAGPILLVGAFILLVVLLGLVTGLALRRRLEERHPQRFQKRKGFDVGSWLFLAGFMMLGSVFLPWGYRGEGIFEVRYGPNFLTGGLGVFVMLAGGMASWGRKRSRGVLIGASLVAVLLGVIVAWARWGNIGEISEGAGRTAIGVWLAFGGGLLGVIGGVGGIVYGLLPGTKIPPEPQVTTPGFGKAVAAGPVQTLEPPHVAPPPPPPAPWNPTHHVGSTPVQAWAEPDPTTGAVATLDPDLPIALVERRGEWALVEAENGWRGWVDARLLVVAEREAAVPAR